MALTAQQRDDIWNLLQQLDAERRIPDPGLGRRLYDLTFATNAEKVTALHQLINLRIDQLQTAIDEADAATVAAKATAAAERDTLQALYDAV